MNSNISFCWAVLLIHFGFCREVPDVQSLADATVEATINMQIHLSDE